MTDPKPPKIILRKRRSDSGEKPPTQPPDAPLVAPDTTERHPTTEQLERIQTLEHELGFEEDAETGRPLIGKALDMRRRELRQLAQESGYTERTADFFDGVWCYDNTDVLFSKYLHHLRKTAAASGKPTVDMSRLEVNVAQTIFPERRDIEDFERLGIEKIDASCSEWWRTTRIGRSRNITLTTLHVKLLRNDLQTRRANRIAEDRERLAAQKAVRAELNGLITDIDDPGSRAEYQLLWLIRKWSGERSLDHVFDIIHTRPAQDLNEVAPVDAYLAIGDERFRLNIKTLSDASAVREYNREIVHRGRDAALAASAEPIILNFVDLRDAYAIETGLPNAPSRRRLPRLRRSIIAAMTDGSRIGHVFPKTMREQLPRIIK